MGHLPQGKAFDIVPDFLLILLWGLEVAQGCVSVEWVLGVRVLEELRDEDVEDVDEGEHRAPCLVDHIQAYSA